MAFPRISCVLSFLMLFPVLFLMRPVEAAAQRYFTVREKKVRTRSLKDSIDKMLYETGVPGLSLAVIDQGKVVYYGYFGYKDSARQKRVDKNTVFEACSLSKSFLVLVAHQLVDEGKLDLDRPMYRYLEYPPLEHDPRYRLITPRMVLSHSSGIENWKWENNPDTLEIMSNPGKRYVYSGEGYDYLAKVMATILHEPYEQYIRERVLEPLGLRHTYLKFKLRKGLFRRGSPRDYAIGHDAFSNDVGKWKNTEPSPASGVNLIASDYARLITASFDGQHLSAKSIGNILTPAIREEQDTSLFYGPGFELIYNGGDTIISQYGVNYGFKANLFYSFVNKRGFVFFTNSDRGPALIERLSDMTAGLDLHGLLARNYFEQYSSQAIDLLRLYREMGGEALYTGVERLRAEGRLGINTLNELGNLFTFQDTAIAERLLLQNIGLHPADPLAYQLLGRLKMDLNHYDSADYYYLEAARLDPGLWQLNDELTACKRMLDEERRRALQLFQVADSGRTTVEAEAYNFKKGMQVEATKDSGAGQNIGSINDGDWLEYRLDVLKSGSYSVACRIASQNGHNLFELQVGEKVLGRVEVPVTNGWQKWVTVTIPVHLDSGSQVLRVFAAKGGFNLNWLQFRPIRGDIAK